MVARPALDLNLLTPEERLDLIEELWESLSESQRAALPLTRAQEEELDRRLDDLEAEGPSGISPEGAGASSAPTPSHGKAPQQQGVPGAIRSRSQREILTARVQKTASPSPHHGCPAVMIPVFTKWS